ncbi:MAG TPA: YicC family protein [Clostridiales bacterium]|nr:YicC family protein [Clostridiales bacterium]
MTGFGKSELAADGRKLRVEMKSVNNRFLDVSVRQPRFMMQYEELVRGFIKENLSRGRVDVYINYFSEREDAKNVVADAALAAAYVKAAREVAGITGVEDDFTLSQLLRMPDVVTYEENDADEQAVRALLLENLRAAVRELKQARAKEGDNLKKDIVKRLDKILEFVEYIHSKAGTVVEEYRRKLQDRLDEMLKSLPVDEQRIAQEIAIYADKSNITEELVRIKSHVKQFLGLVDSDGAQGRNMDFLVQELNREFNTIGSKSQDTGIMNKVISGKAEVEKIREQIQNIE